MASIHWWYLHLYHQPRFLTRTIHPTGDWAQWPHGWMLWPQAQYTQNWAYCILTLLPHLHVTLHHMPFTEVQSLEVILDASVSMIAFSSSLINFSCWQVLSNEWSCFVIIQDLALLPGPRRCYTPCLQSHSHLTVLMMVVLTHKSDHALHLHKPGSGSASFLSHAVEDVAAVFLFSLIHHLPHVPSCPYLPHSWVFWTCCNCSHLWIFAHSTFLLHSECHPPPSFLGRQENTSFLFNTSYIQELSSWNRSWSCQEIRSFFLECMHEQHGVSSIYSLQYVVIWFLPESVCLTRLWNQKLPLQSFCFFPVPSTGPITQEMLCKSLLSSTWYLMDKDLQFQAQANLQATSIILKTISIPLKQFSHRTNEIYFGDQ